MRLRPSAVSAVATFLLLAATAAYARGLPPFAANDSATVPRGGSVSVLSTGQSSVLANDFDFEGDMMTATLTREPMNGTVMLNSDGTFLYTHDGSSTTTDSFRYRGHDGTSASFQEATVQITILGPGAAPAIVGQRNLVVAEDRSITVRLQDLTVLDPDSDYPQDFSLTLGAGENYTVQAAVVTPAADFNGTLTVPTRVNDGQSDSNEFPLQIAVSPRNDAPLEVQPLPEQEATEDEPFSLDVAPAFEDIDAGDTLTFTAAGLPPSGSLTMSPAGVLSGTPLEIDTLQLVYDVEVTARDASGASAQTNFGLRILPRRVDLAIAITADPDPTTFGAAPQWSLEIENVSGSRSDPGTVVADWHSTAPVSLTAPAGCTIINNLTSNPRVECEVSSVPADTTETISIQGAQSAPGDQAVVATLDAGDANAANDVAFKSLSLAGRFNEAPAQRIAGAATDIVLRDLDGDGLADLAAAGEELRVFFNTGDRALDATAVVPAAASVGETLAVLDWNRDGLPDVAVLRSAGAAGSIFLNDGARGLSAGPALPAVAASAAVVADADLDGGDDLVVAGADGTYVLAPGESAVRIDTRAASDVATADFDADGRPDFATALAGGSVAVLVNGGAAFVATTIPGFAGLQGIAAADVTADGAPDLLLAVDVADFAVPENVLLANDGAGAFTPLVRFGATESADVHAADVDGDGLDEVVAINESGVHQVYYHDGVAGLVLDEEFVLSTGTRKAAFGDIDGDGAPDLVLAGPATPDIEVLRNNGLGRFGPGDVTAPVITLLGASSVTIPAASNYEDAGATATDDVGGDLTAEIVVDNPVDSTIVGTYEISYNVTDRAGNAGAPVFRTVVVEAATGGGGGGGALGPLLLAALAALAALRSRGSRRANAPGRRKAF